MFKPQGFDESKVTIASPLLFPPKPGPTKLVIIKLWHEQKDGKTVLRMWLDIAEGQSKGFFTHLSEAKKKDIYITHYQGTDGKGLGYYKGIITSIEKSNEMKIDWDGPEDQCQYKFIGSNLRNEGYYDDDGKEQMSLKPVYFCSVQSLKEDKHEIFADKPAKVKGQTRHSPNGENPPDFTDDDLPF